MSKYYKVALAIDAVDKDFISRELEAVKAKHPARLEKTYSTPDNEYIVTYWDDIQWDTLLFIPLQNKLKTIRHSLFTISEDGEFWADVKDEDSRGCDEEFDEILSWRAYICLCDEPL